MANHEVRDCFKSAAMDEKNGKKHKGLLVSKPDEKIAKEYLNKARTNLELCSTYKKGGFDYMIPEKNPSNL